MDRTPDDATNDAELFGSLAGRTLARLAKQVERAISGSELSLPQYRLLTLLANGAAMSSALAENLAVKPPTVTSVVDGLVSRGLVERRSDPTDRRRLPLSLTDAGYAVVRQANAAIGERLFAVLAELDQLDARTTAVDGLTAWQTGLDHLRDRKKATKGAG